MLKLSLFISLFLVISACGLLKDSTLDPIFTPGTKAFPAEYVGTWCTPCRILESGISVRLCVAIGNERRESSTGFILYQGDNCQTRLLRREHIDDLIEIRQATIQNRFGFHIISAVKSVLITPFSTTGALILNNNHECGFTNWIANAPKDISGTSCEVNDFVLGKIAKSFSFVEADQLSVFDWNADGTPPTDLSTPLLFTREP